MVILWYYYGNIMVLSSEEERNCQKGNTMSNPIHTSITRMFGDYGIPFYILSGGQYIAEVAQGKIRYSLSG